jgi:hypothetical protein
VWPEGFLLSDSVAQGTLTTSGGRKFAQEQRITSAVQASPFYADGIVASTRNMYGGTVFSSNAHSVWGASVLDPASVPAGLATLRVLANNDNSPIPGLRFIGSSSPYYPTQQ